MKKLLLIPILTLLLLCSCNKDPYIYDSTSQTLETTTTNTIPEIISTDNDVTSNNEENVTTTSKPGDVYDDDIIYGPFH